MKTKIFLSMFVLFACATSLSAQITREEADKIAINYAKSVMEQSSFLLFVNDNTSNEDGFSITTANGEKIKAKYACWVYYLHNINEWAVVAPAQRQYLFVKEDNGSLLEIIVNDLTPNLNSWTKIDLPTGIVVPKENTQSLYPNPVDDWLTIPCNGANARVEIYDLKGSRLFSETLSDKDACRLNVSFLSAGVYIVNVEGKTYKMVKK